MAWSIVGVSSAVTATATPLTLTEPAGVADGDLLVACFASRSTATTAVTNTGWTQVNFQATNNTSATAGSAIASGTMLYQVRAGTPDLTFDLPAGISVAMGGMVAYRGNAAVPFIPSIVPTANARGVASGAVYATVRNTVSATSVPGATAGGIGQAEFGLYNCNQYFLTFNTSAVPVEQTTATLMLNVTAVGVGADVLEVREVSSTANTIAGDSLASNLLLGSISIPASAVGLMAIQLDISGMSRTSSTKLILHSQEQRTATPPANNDSGTTFSSLAAVSGLKPYMAISPVTAVTTATGTSAVSVTGLTTVTEDTLIVAMCAGGQEAAWSAFTNVTTPLTASGATDTTTAPSTTAWIERADVNTTTGADTSLAIFDAVRTSTGATGNLTATASIASGHVVIAGAFKIASSNIFTGTGTATLAASAAAAGVEGQAGTATATVNASASASGTHASPVTGTAAATLTASASASGAHGVTSTASATIALTGAASGEHGASGTAAAVLALSAAAVGAFYGQVTGTAAATLALSAAAAGEFEEPGAAAGTVGVWNGSAFVQKPAKVWSGSAWVQKPVKTWNGTSWAA